MRNNFEDRLRQVKESANNETISSVMQSDSLLSFVSPIELVELPSKGKFYSEGHPLKNKDVIEIKQMTAKEEDILTNKSLIKRGVVIDRLIESLLVDKSIPVESLLVGDKNAIMVATRIAAYGQHYDVIVGCAECGAKNVTNIDLREVKIRESEQIINDANANQNLLHEQLENGNIVIKLPRTGWTVECRLMDGSDERKILATLEIKRKKDPLAELSVSEQLKIIVTSINSVTDENLIDRAIDAMPAYDAKILRNTYQKLIPNVTIQKRYTCSSCLEEQDLEVPFTQEFFWPK